MAWKCSFILLVLCTTLVLDICQAFVCQSCFTGCRSLDDCDCGDRTENSTCHAPFCYAKLEYFTDDGSVSAIQKGCINEISDAFFGCQYASDDRSIACYCAGDLCNNAFNLSVYDTPDLPLIECCECNEDETGQESCQPQNCARNCTGNYCYLDLVANAQGCGWGHPQLFHFIRARNYSRWSHELTCAEYYDNYRNYMNGCTCAKDYCNAVADLDRLRNGQRASSDRARGQHFCYSLYANSDTEFGEEIFRRSSLCPSYLCFVSWTTVEVVFDPGEDEEDDSGALDLADFGSGEFDYYAPGKRAAMPALRSSYEISAGCLSVDNIEKVQIGCTIEWSQSETAPLTKHCVCAEKLCNHFRLIDSTTSRTTTPASDLPNGRLMTSTLLSTTGSSHLQRLISTLFTTIVANGRWTNTTTVTPAHVLLNAPSKPEKATSGHGSVSTTFSPVETINTTSLVTSLNGLLESTSIGVENQSFVPVTSAFITSPITDWDVNTTSGHKNEETTETPSSTTVISSSPKGQIPDPASSMANERTHRIRAFFLFSTAAFTIFLTAII